MEFYVPASARCRVEDIEKDGLPTILVLEKEIRSTFYPWGHFELVLVLAFCLVGLLWLGWFEVSADVGLSDAPHTASTHIHTQQRRRRMSSIEEILQTHSIGEIRQLVEELNKDANSKQGELQLMV
jgi:hypothetical protein